MMACAISLVFAFPPRSTGRIPCWVALSMAFMMAVAIAASMAFASPVASPANTLVMGAGTYRFGDYVKVGVPLILVGLGVTTLCLPLLWPL
jgi:di/tricarboxylate transporter